MDRKSWSETAGLEYLHNLASKEDSESIKVAIEGRFYITCSLAAVSGCLEV
jgi:DNA mismatch repair protein MSH4